MISGLRGRTYGERLSLLGILTRARLDIRINFFSHRVVEEWNNLPDDMRKRLNLVAFKSKLKLLLLESEASGSLLESH